MITQTPLASGTAVVVMSSITGIVIYKLFSELLKRKNDLIADLERKLEHWRSPKIENVNIERRTDETFQQFRLHTQQVATRSVPRYLPLQLLPFRGSLIRGSGLCCTQ